MQFVVSSAIVILCCQLCSADLPAPTDVSLVFVGFRHGDRNPSKFLPNDPNAGKWGLEGTSQLTNIGKMQAYGLGQLVRSRYGTLISEHFFPNETKATSSPLDRCQMTTQAMLAGLYPPVTWSVWNANITWQPVSVYLDEPLLAIDFVNECGPQNDAWNAVDNAQTYQGKKVFAEKKDLITFMANNTGWKADLDDAAATADNIYALKERNLVMPSWVTNNPFNKDLYDDIVYLTEIPEKLCAADTPCRWLMAGYWLNDIVTKMQQKQNGSITQKLFVYGTHNEIVSSLFWTMGVNEWGVPYNGAIIVEFKTTPSAQVRVIYSVPIYLDPQNRNSTVVQLPGCGGEWCPLNTFMNTVQKYLIPNYQVPCQYPVCFCSPATQKIQPPQVDDATLQAIQTFT